MSALGYAQLLMAQPARNFAILDPVRKSPNVTVVGTLQGDGKTSGSGVGIATVGKNSGKWYWEAIVNNCTTGTYGKIGVTNVLMAPPYSVPSGLGAGGAGGTGGVGYWGTTVADATTKVGTNFAGTLVQVPGNGGQIVNGDVLSVAFDAGANQVTFYRNGVLSVTINLLPTGGMWYPAFASTPTTPVTSVTFNFGQNAWSGTTEALRASLLSSGYVIGLYA